MAVTGGCGGGSGGTAGVAGPAAGSGAGSAAATDEATTGTGTLVISVIDSDGQALSEAGVTVWTPLRSKIIRQGLVAADGVLTIASLPPTVDVGVIHEFGEHYRNRSVSVAQGGTTRLAITLQAARPRPTVALLPVSIPAGGLSADRRELLLQVRLVAAADTPFPPAQEGGEPGATSPGLTLNLQDPATGKGENLCYAWRNSGGKVPACANPSGPSPYTVAVDQLAYDETGQVPTLVAPTPARSVMLLMDQSGRVEALDPARRRSFAARRFVERITSLQDVAGVSLQGYAKDRPSPPAPALLPRQPLWSPLGHAYSLDPLVLGAAIQDLEPRLGGAAPVHEALMAALASIAAGGPQGNRALVAVLGGDDDSIADGSTRAANLETLRRMRDGGGVLPVLINAARLSEPIARQGIAEIAAALRAPVVVPGTRLGPDREPQPWSAGIHAALQLAADLAAGSPLPTLTTTFRVRTSAAAGFAPGTTLRGTVFAESEICPLGCSTIPVEFVATIP